MEQQLRTVLDIGRWFEAMITWLTVNFDGFFDATRELINGILLAFQAALVLPGPYIMIALFAVLAFWRSGIGTGIFTLLGMYLIHIMGFWEVTMDTLALVITSVVIALFIGVPLGIMAAKNDMVERIVRPLLDFMQTLPAFVYLIPAVLFFQLGAVPGVIATLIFSLPLPYGLPASVSGRYPARSAKQPPHSGQHRCRCSSKQSFR